jgi:hypothetical protein
MRVRTLTRWLTIMLWSGILAPATAWGQVVTQSPASEPLPQPTILTIAPQEKQDKPAMPPPEVAPAPTLRPVQPTVTTVVQSPVMLPPMKPGMMPSLPGQVMGTNVCPVLDGGMPPFSESAAGFIDSALIGTHLRLRLDGRFNNTRPDRAAYLMSKTQEFPLPVTVKIPLGSGLPVSERKIDMEEFSIYAEYACCERFSVFGSLPIRALQPEINDSQVGLADVNVGAKLAVFALPDLVQTLQFRVYCPTGKANEGLGSDIFAIEPAFLVYNRLTPRWTLEGEIRDWIPIGEPEFAGSVLHYGITAAYDLTTAANGWSVRPVFGLWGVAFINGRQTVLGPTGPVLEDARERILNADLGVRLGGNGSSIYVGFSQVLSGSSLFENEVRLEWRYNY